MEHLGTTIDTRETPPEPTAVAAQIHSTAIQARQLLTSSQIDAAQGYGASYHPLTGDMLVGLRFDTATGQFIKTTTHLGFGHSSTTVKTLDRIGDGKDHDPSELPLQHWKFDPRTGQPLTRAAS